MIVGFFLAYFPFPASAAVARHKNGELVSGGGTVYLLENNQRRGFAAADEFFSYGYEWEMVLPANPEDTKLPQGSNMRIRGGSLVLDKSDDRTMYLVFDDGARPIPGMDQMVFIRADGRKYYSFDLSAYPKGPAVGFDFVYLNHPVGSLVDIGGTIYLITKNGKAPFPSAEIFRSYGYDFNMALPGTALDQRLATLANLKYRDGSLINDNGTIFLVSEGRKFGFKSWSGFLSSGYSASSVIEGSLAGYPEGESFE